MARAVSVGCGIGGSYISGETMAAKNWGGDVNWGWGGVSGVKYKLQVSLRRYDDTVLAVMIHHGICW
jgi:hypothetical protein